MKYILCAFLSFLFLVSGKTEAVEESKLKGLSTDSQVMYRFIGVAGNKVGKQFNMNPCGFGAGHNKAKEKTLVVSFQRRGVPILEPEARRLLIACVNAFLAEANQSEELKSVIGKELTGENIKMAIFNYKADGWDVFDPFISAASHQMGKISYFTDEPDNLRYKSKKYETYEEAVAILAKEKEDGVPVRNIVEIDRANKKARKWWWF